MIMTVFLGVNPGWAQREYEHILTAGMDPEDPDYDPDTNYDTINGAVVAMNQKQPPLGPDTLGCIRVYPGIYEEHLNDLYAPDGHNLPAHCDLIGMADDPCDVVIQHARDWDDTERHQIGWHGIHANGDNIISNLNVYNHEQHGLKVFSQQDSVWLEQDSQMNNCIVVSEHRAIQGHGEKLVITNCTVYSRHLFCIRADSTFSISDCNLYPRGYTPVIETPTGIVACGSGTIKNVKILATLSDATYREDDGALIGIQLLGRDEQEHVSISHTQIDLELTSEYLEYAQPLRVCGIVSGLIYGSSGPEYKGRATVRNCTIDVTGIEEGWDTPETDDDGAPTSVDEIFIRRGGTMAVHDTNITTSRTAAGNGVGGHHYVLNNENGTLYVDFDSVTLDPDDPEYMNGTITEHRVENTTQDTEYFFIQDAIDDANDGDVIEAVESIYYENVNFKGVSCTVTSPDPDDWDVVERTVIDADQSGSVVTFNSSEDSDSVLSGFTITGGYASNGAGIYCSESSPTIKNCIITDNKATGTGGGLQNLFSACPTVTNCIFSGNSASVYGGAVYSQSSHPTVKNCVFWQNNSADGGGITNIDSSPSLTGCTFSKNSADSGGGGGMYNAKLIGTCSPRITNCILWGNTADEEGDNVYNLGSPDPTFSYCDIKGCGGSGPGNWDPNFGTDCGGNIDKDPLFAAWIPTDGLVSKWKFDEGSGSIAYDSVGDNDASLYGAQWTTDMVDDALSFDGNDYLNCPDHNSLDITSEITISAWIYRDDTGPDYLVAKRDGDEQQYGIYLYNSQVWFCTFSSPDSYTGTTQTLDTGKWYHIACTFDSNAGEGEIYINGLPKATDKTASAITSADSDLFIGARGDGAGGATFCFDGIIDDVAIYNKVLSAYEVEQMLQRGLTGQDDYHLSWRSPCFNAGDPNGDCDAQTDIDGQPRVMIVIPEIGADEMKSSMHFGVSMKEPYYSHIFDSYQKMKYLIPNFTWIVRNVAGDRDAYDSMVSELHSANPNAILGNYMSACFASSAAEDDDPNIPRYIHYDDPDFDSTWILLADSNDPNSYITSSKFPYLRYLDMNMPEARSAIIDLAIERALDRNLDAINFDNCYWGVAPRSDVNPYDANEWTAAFMNFYSEANSAADACRLRLIFNVATGKVGRVEDAFEAVSPYADGLMTEWGFHPNRRTDSGLSKEVAGYETVLKTGTMVLIFASKAGVCDIVNSTQNKAFGVSKIRPLAEKYGNIYLVRFGNVLDSKGQINDSLACLDDFGTNLIANGDFSDWSSGEPNDWTVALSTQDPNNAKIAQVGYVVKAYSSNADANSLLLQDSNGLDPNNNTDYGSGACNLYTTDGKDVSVSQNITTVAGELYRVSIYIGQTKPYDPNLVGTLAISGDNGSTFDESFSKSGVKTFTFEAASSTTAFKISTGPDELVDISFDDVAVWRID